MARKWRSSSGAEMTMMQHLSELRSRLVRSVLAIAVSTIVTLLYYEPILEFLTKPYRKVCTSNPKFKCDGTLFTLGPLDGLSARVRIATYCGLIVALPIILWQVWRFIAPALANRERRYAVSFIVSSFTLFGLGCFLAYWTLDKALEFLIAWSGTDVSQAFQIGKYVNLVLMMALAFGIGFLSPVLIVFLQLVGIVQPRTLVKQWRYAVMGIFVVAAVITPSGDPFSLFVLAVPMTVLYVIAVGVGWLVLRRRSRVSVG